MNSKLREALSKASIALSWATHHHLTEDDAKECLEIIDAALAEPPMNCDVGTADEQSERFLTFCTNHQTFDGCSECPLYGSDRCEIAWTQMPYEAKERKGKK